MAHVLVVGSGKIGSMVASLLSSCDDYQITLIDKDFSNNDVVRLLETNPRLNHQQIDITDRSALSRLIQEQKIEAIISCLPYFLNQHIIPIAKKHQCHYFDLTEDMETAALVKETAVDASTAFVPQCGLAPGFISVAANSLMNEFDQCETVNCRVGALPQHSNNALKYALTWSTEGLINIYGNPCHAIENGKHVLLDPLDGYETLQLDGVSYEAFNTSGGLGGLGELCDKRVKQLNYKTIRYPGHWQIMRVLMHDLRLNEKRDLLTEILEDALPSTYDDVVLVYVAVTGFVDDRFLEKTYFKKCYPQTINGLKWSAIQTTTAAEVCAIVDCVLQDQQQYQGMILQETFSLDTLLQNRFGKLYA